MLSALLGARLYTRKCHDIRIHLHTRINKFSPAQKPDNVDFQPMRRGGGIMALLRSENQGKKINANQALTGGNTPPAPVRQHHIWLWRGGNYLTSAAHATPTTQYQHLASIAEAKPPCCPICRSLMKSSVYIGRRPTALLPAARWKSAAGGGVRFLPLTCRANPLSRFFDRDL